MSAVRRTVVKVQTDRGSDRVFGYVSDACLSLAITPQFRRRFDGWTAKWRREIGPGWTVTHIRSGRAVIGYLPSLGAAFRVLRALQELGVDWTLEYGSVRRQFTPERKQLLLKIALEHGGSAYRRSESA